MGSMAATRARAFPPGIHPPSLTWFKDNDAQDIDWDLQRRHLKFLVESGVHGVVLAGTNGEAATLTRDEKTQLIRVTREVATEADRADLPVTVGCVGQCTRDVIADTKAAHEAGADFALVLTPSFFHFAMNEDAIVGFFTELADASPIPIVIYNFPGVAAGLDVNSEMLAKLGAHPNIVGAKLTCGGIAKVARIKAQYEPQEFAAIAGQSDWLLPALTVGGIGTVTGVGNLYPRACIQIFDLFSEGKLAEAASAQVRLAEIEWGFGKGGINVLPTNAAIQESFDDVFNYASFMWDGNEIWESPNWGHQNLSMLDSTAPHPIATPSFSPTLSPPLGNTLEVAMSSTHSDGQPSMLDEHAVALNVPSEDRVLLDYFVKSVVPPIIAQVETQSRWISMRQTLLSMSQSSSMLRNAILAFSALFLSRQGELVGDTKEYYTRTASELARHDQAAKSESKGREAARRAAVLAALFFLSYTDLLEGRIDLTHANLKKAYDIYKSADKEQFRNVEIRLLSWIRLIDARAVSAGGQGLFLSESDEKLLSYSSPGSHDGAEPGTDEQPERDIEEVLFDILYQPGIDFYQKVQSFMGRISHQDPWHRRRNTVEDETEVMNIAAEISKDLRLLYEARPPLMDYAVAGLLKAPHVSPNLAFTITRAFRTFLSNYHASKIHLHRVAYKSLPLTNETNESIEAIRNLAKMLVEGPQDMLPVNMLWPLLMWGTEEKSLEERAWIKSQILCMEKVATNARITSQVLDEVQRRQDSMNARQDIREVMEHIFNSCFAIV
ncbi:hypothetical protein DL765_004259 [Monosporascus sp. GIB2]|nr:hypothetical protein DL765_004259 [Monosporascus sp. GIB2]